MRTVLLRSFAIAFTVAPMTWVLASLLFTRVMIPLPSYDYERMKAMSYSDATQYQLANYRRISGIEYFTYVMTQPRLLATNIEPVAICFAAVFVGCVWLGVWQERGRAHGGAAIDRPAEG